MPEKFLEKLSSASARQEYSYALAKAGPGKRGHS